MDVICNECKKLLFKTDIKSPVGIGIEAQDKGFTYKNACLFSDKYTSLYFCSEECTKKFYQENIQRDEKITEILKDFKKDIPKISKEVAQNIGHIVNQLNRINNGKNNKTV